MGSTHSEPCVYAGFVPGDNFLTAAQTVGIQVKHGGPAELRRQRSDSGTAGAAETCRVLSRMEEAAQS